MEISLLALDEALKLIKELKTEIEILKEKVAALEKWQLENKVNDDV